MLPIVFTVYLCYLCVVQPSGVMATLTRAASNKPNSCGGRRSQVPPEIGIDEGIRTDIMAIKTEMESVVKKEDLQSMLVGLVKKDDVKELVTDIAGKIIGQLKEELMRNMESKILEKTAKMREEMDMMNNHNYRLQEALKQREKEITELKQQQKESCDLVDRMKEEVDSVKKLAIEGIKKGNHNEQYSRRNNIKVINMKELNSAAEESQRDIAQDFCDIINSKIDAELSPGDLAAIHRVPGRDPEKPRPWIVKFWQKDVRNYVVRRRKQLNGTIKIVDDVTKENVLLINRLNADKTIDNAWYFNGKVFAECGGVRKQVDLFDSVVDVFKQI